MNEGKVKIRNSNYELMRIISMFLIVLYHTIHHGVTIDLAVNPYAKLILEVLRMITVVHVNSFILVTGYFQCNSRFRLSKILELILLSTFYKLIIIFTFNHFDLIEFSSYQLIRELFPLDLVHNWYFKYYLILYFLSPFINKAINNLNKRSYRNLIILLMIFFSIIPMLTNSVGLENHGYTLYQFFFMYVLGAYFRKYPFEIKISKFVYRLTLLLIFGLCVFINFCLFKESLKHIIPGTLVGELAIAYQLYFLYYSNIIIVIQSIVYFLLFGTFSFSNKIVNHISKMMFGVYLIHDNNYIRANIYNWLNINNELVYSFRYFAYVIWIAIVVFVGSYIVESLRCYICALLKKIVNFKVVEEKLDNFQLCD